MCQLMTLLMCILLLTPSLLPSTASRSCRPFTEDECDTDTAKELGRAVSYANQPALSKLIAAGVNVHARVTVEPRSIIDPTLRVRRKWTALMIAANNDFPDTTNMLLDAGADPNAADEDGETALTIAINKRWEALQTVITLIGADAAPSDLSSSGRPPRVPSASSILAKRRIRADVNVITKNGETPLLRAVRLGHCNIARALVKAGAHRTPTIAGKPCSALDKAIDSGNQAIMLALS